MPFYQVDTAMCHVPPVSGCDQVTQVPGVTPVTPSDHIAHSAFCHDTVDIINGLQNI